MSDVKRQAVVELQKAVRAAEEKANEAVGQSQSKVDKAVMEARRQAIEETLGLINRQSDSSEVSNIRLCYSRLSKNYNITAACYMMVFSEKYKECIVSQEYL